MKSAINWFEIPTDNLDRAAAFYEKLLGVSLRREDFMGTPHAIFPNEKPGVGGALIRDAQRRAGSNGTTIYLDATGKLDGALERVSGAGGAVVVPKTSIGPMGEFALVRDTEGNVVGLHAA